MRRRKNMVYLVFIILLLLCRFRTTYGSIYLVPNILNAAVPVKKSCCCCCCCCCHFFSSCSSERAACSGLHVLYCREARTSCRKDKIITSTECRIKFSKPKTDKFFHRDDPPLLLCPERRKYKEYIAFFLLLCCSRHFFPSFIIYYTTKYQIIIGTY